MVVVFNHKGLKYYFRQISNIVYLYGMLNITYIVVIEKWISVAILIVMARTHQMPFAETMAGEIESMKGHTCSPIY